jgi:Predicted Zn-dependent proteases and their inactivated homologs
MDFELQDLADKAVKYAMNNGAQYCDSRAEQQERKTVLIENGEIEYVRTNDNKGIGVRVIKKGVWSFFSVTDPNSFEKIKNEINNALKNSIHYTKNKKTKSICIQILSIKLR